jgi:hypothetical protein
MNNRWWNYLGITAYGKEQGSGPTTKVKVSESMAGRRLEEIITIKNNVSVNFELVLSNYWCLTF